MTINTDIDKDLAEIMPEVLKMRVVLKGAPFVKMAGQALLPSPNQLDKQSDQAIAAYNAYKAGAEFDEYTSQTSGSMIGKLNLDDFTPELPREVEYLVNDVDGDGCSLKGLTESLASNVLAVKWHIAAVDYQGLQGLAIEDVSVSDAEKINPRPKIKQYSRESVIKRRFSTINGKRQLSLLMLLEVGETFDNETFEKKEVKSYLILALDENGDYYQQKIVEGTEDNQVGERDYVFVGKDKLHLKFIPALIVSDQEICQKLLLELGMLNPIADICLHKYRVSANYKEAMRKFVPTTDVFGVTETGYETFKKINSRSYRAIGQTNIWPDADTKIETTSTNGSLDPFENYDDSRKEKIRSFGGVAPDYSNGDTSATEAMINNAEQNAHLNPLVTSLERAIKTLVSYCAMFEGLVSQDEVNDYQDKFTFDMPRDFAKVSPDVEAGRFVIEMVNSSLMTTRQATKKLIALGWHEGEIDDVLAEVEVIPPNIIVD